MKYSFIFDQDFLDEKLFFLSQEEIHLIECVITGGHNVCLRGYKPERIVDAIKTVVGNTQTVVEPSLDISFQDFVGGGPELNPGAVSLANDGILVMKNLNEFRASVAEILVAPMENGTVILSYGGKSVEYRAKFQLITTLSAKDSLNSSHSAVSKCDIDYVCRYKDDRGVIKASELKNSVETAWECHQSIHNSIEKNQEITGFVSRDFSTQAWEKYVGYILSTYPSCSLRIAKVARTLADMRCHTQIRCYDLETAESLHVPHFE